MVNWGKWALVIAIFGLVSACSQVQTTEQAKSGGYVNFPNGGGLYVSSTFDGNGRLWRVIPESQHVYVDHSDDAGKTFSAPINLNHDAQKIKVSGENRPGIVADKSGAIYVIYAAEANQPVNLFYSVSNDGGLHFSAPRPLSDKADEANNFQGRLGLDQFGKAYVFWHDERTRTDWQQPGNAIYSAQIDANTGTASTPVKVTDMLCDCCRIALAFDQNNDAILLTRFVYAGNVRDHGMVKVSAKTHTTESWRVTNDNWTIEACPEHGPAISMGADNSLHIAWFTQGNRQGLYYAHSSDNGRHFSTPVSIGNINKLPSHADVLVQGKSVYLTWIEFDGQKASLQVQTSTDGGGSWSAPKLLAEMSTEVDYPFFLLDKGKVFVSWNSKSQGYQLFALN